MGFPERLFMSLSFSFFFLFLYLFYVLVLSALKTIAKVAMRGRVMRKCKAGAWEFFCVDKGKGKELGEGEKEYLKLYGNRYVFSS